jgi:uncharacterized membrane protein HdeD (DUF308 family)
MIGILLGIVFFVLLAKAIFETIWGTCLIINGIFWHTVAFLLRAMAFVIRTCKKVIGLFRKPKPAPREFSMANAINLYFSNTK